MKVYSTRDSSNDGMGQQEIFPAGWCWQVVRMVSNSWIRNGTSTHKLISKYVLKTSFYPCMYFCFLDMQKPYTACETSAISPFFFLEALILDTLQQRSIGVRNAGDSMQFIEFRASRETTATGCQEKLCENRFRNFNFGEILHTEIYVRRCWTTSKKTGHFQGCEALRGSFLLHAACLYMCQFKVFKI